MNPIFPGKFRLVAALMLAAVLPMVATAAEAPAADFARGPHNGRLLVDGDFALELAIFETGVPPEYHVWASENGQAIAPQNFALAVELTRLGGQVDSFEFAPVEDYLRSLSVVHEPHSFDVDVTARYNNAVHTWSFPSYEGRVQMAAALAEQSGLTTAIAGPGTIRQEQRLYGQVLPLPELITEVGARFPGMIRSMTPGIGDRVVAGQVLARVEANESLRSYDITAPHDGVVVARHANPGEIAGTAPLFTIADHSKLYLHLAVFPQQAVLVKVGQPLRLMHGNEEIHSEIDVMVPDGDSPTLSAHADLDNSDGSWTPGAWISADVTVADEQVPLRIDNRALQGFRDWQVVFIKIGDNYEIRPLELGRSDGSFSEVLGGLNPGDVYVVGNSYLLKADLEKSGASHDH